MFKERGRDMPAMLERGHEAEDQKEKQRQGGRGFMRLAQCPAFSGSSYTGHRKVPRVIHKEDSDISC